MFCASIQPALVTEVYHTIPVIYDIRELSLNPLYIFNSTCEYFKMTVTLCRLSLHRRCSGAVRLSKIVKRDLASWSWYREHGISSSAWRRSPSEYNIIEKRWNTHISPHVKTPRSLGGDTNKFNKRKPPYFANLSGSQVRHHVASISEHIREAGMKMSFCGALTASLFERVPSDYVSTGGCFGTPYESKIET